MLLAASFHPQASSAEGFRVIRQKLCRVYVPDTTVGHRIISIPQPITAPASVSQLKHGRNQGGEIKSDYSFSFQRL